MAMKNMTYINVEEIVMGAPLTPSPLFYIDAG
jgi:hypothetical protein